MHQLFGPSDHTATLTCYATQSFPHTLAWSKHYTSDPDTNTFLTQLKQRKNKTDNPWTKETYNSVNPAYHVFMQRNLVSILHSKLVVYKEIFPHKKYVVLIFVPTNLRKAIFSHYHSSPSGGHMGVYKTTYRIRFRFFWPRKYS